MSRRILLPGLTVPGIRPGVVLAVAAVALAPVAVFAPNGTVVLLAVTGAVLALDERYRQAAFACLYDRAAQLILAFLAVSLAASLWSFDPARGMLQSLRLTLLFAAGFAALGGALRLAPDEARMARRGMALGGLLLVGLMLVETASGAVLTQLVRGIDAAAAANLGNGAPLSRGGIILAIFLWPTLWAVRREHGAWALAPPVAAALAALWLQPIEANLVAAAAGTAVFAAASWRPGLAGRLGAIGVVVVLLVPPLAAALLPAVYDPADLAEMAQSHRHRVEIWSYALERILERPVFGWGFDSSRELMGTGAGAVRPDAPMSLHTHNVTLQAWLELGLPGVAVIVALGFALWRRAAGSGRAVAPAALAGFAAWLVYAEISRGAWQTWWLAAAFLFAVWIAALARPAEA